MRHIKPVVAGNLARVKLQISPGNFIYDFILWVIRIKVDKAIRTAEGFIRSRYIDGLQRAREIGFFLHPEDL
jgi:hypothetical protein